MASTLDPETAAPPRHQPAQDSGSLPASSRWRWILVGLLLAAGWAALAIDLPVAHTFGDLGGHERLVKIPGDLRRFLDLCEVYAHGLGVAMIGLTILVLDWENRIRLPRILACAYLGGLLAVSFKLWIERIRPGEFLAATGADATTVWESFRSVAGLWQNDASSIAALHGHAVQSFPSGHAATATGLAAGLVWRYPHAAWLFVVFAVLASLQRINCQAHWTSDVLIGAGCGLLVAECLLSSWGLGGQFDRLEGTPQRTADA